MFPILLIIFLNSDIDLLDLTKLGNLFQIKDPRNCRPCGTVELNPVPGYMEPLCIWDKVSKNGLS